jgi:outer membrane protein OmpA-like peptidoglycan-associated protein
MTVTAATTVGTTKESTAKESTMIISSPKSLTRLFALTLGLPLLSAACATATPIELTNARVAYSRASAGPAAQLTPTDLHKAKSALDKAEQSLAEGKDLQRTIDLAYVAERTAEIAEARATASTAEQTTAKATQEYGVKQGEIAKATEGALVKTREQLAQQTQQSGVDRTARESADKNAAASEQKAAASELKANEANDALAKLAAKDEERGMVITLSGSVLFRSNDATLLPAAETRLDQVADALVAKNRDVVVEGYTDSRGSAATNMSLSQRRAESVRARLVSRGFPGAKITARGMGADKPIAENSNAEGRANNRRVEIVVLKTP